MVSALLADLRRPWLWKGSGIASLLVIGLLATLVVAAILESTTPPPDLEGVLRGAGLSLMLAGAGVMGSFSFTADFRAGCLTRRVLLFQRNPAFIARALTTALAAILSGAMVGICFGLAGGIFAQGWQVSPHVVLAFAGMAAMGSAWGFAIGSLLRSHLVSLFAVPLSLVVPQILSLGNAETYLFPFEAAEWANQAAVHIPASESFFGAVAWLLIILGAACAVFSRRDLA
ncbi:hypothetical protein [Paenarthrobacter sp. 2TAF44]|uniref:hypothetical protein n=1 Tax=Paenarthrobacter sp. 2TAF44 TaxID=3233018 RepID=UPI003F9B51D3